MMNVLRSGPWRPFFILAGALIMAGGPQHPGGDMAQMLAHPDWVLSHVLVLGGFVSLLIGLVLYRRGAEAAAVGRWARLAVVGTALQVVEMVFHTAAVVDGPRLAAGEATPVLTTHLWLAVVLYPAFALSMIALVVAGARSRALGSRWIAWLGVLGLAAHGAAAPIVVLGGPPVFRILFPMVMFFALWLVFAAFWPMRAAAPVPGAPARAPDADRVPAPVG
jgi:hypothetical protein